MDNTQLRALLTSAKTIAILGAKDVEGQPVDRCGRYLIKAGYTVIPVHPKRNQVWGLKTYKNILEIPHPVDIIDVFRASEYCPGHAREVLALPVLPRVFWMQLGIENEEAKITLAEKGIVVVENACLAVEHERLFPFDTGSFSI